jgi:hypothetical protein
MQHAASLLLVAIEGHTQLDAGVAAEVLRLQNDPAVVEMQLQLLTAWTAQLHKQHTAQQQLPTGTAGAGSSSSSSSSSSTQQQRQQPAKQQHRADLLSIPTFHQDMLQLLPGGQAYLDAAAEEVAAWVLTGEQKTVMLHSIAGNCCCTIHQYLHSQLNSIAGQLHISKTALVSGAAVRLVLELQLLASGAVQRQREQHRQQQQQALTPEDQAFTDNLALNSWDLLRLQIKALVATSRSCLPPEVLQQAGLQLLQALAAPLQQWQLSRTSDSFLRTADVAGVLPLFGDTLLLLVTAACGAQPGNSQVQNGENEQCLLTTATAAAALHSTWRVASLDVKQGKCYMHDQSLYM